MTAGLKGSASWWRLTFLCLCLIGGGLRSRRLLADAVLPLVSGVPVLAVLLRRLHLLLLLVGLAIFVALTRDHLEKQFQEKKKKNDI